MSTTSIAAPQVVTVTKRLTEKEFRVGLAQALRRCWLSTSSYNSSKIPITQVIEEKNHPTFPKSRPDITVYHKGIKLVWRELTNPFFIECKVDWRDWYKRLLQATRYKYRYLSENHRGLKKYGDYQVIFATPLLDNAEQSYEKELFVAKRVLWHSGVGFLGIQDGRMCAEFNEQERVWFIQRGTNGQ